MSIYSLKSVLATFSKPNGKKRTIYNLSPVGGISSTFVGLFFLSLPFIEFALIFNPTVFNMLGIAQSIVFFIVFLSVVMIIIFLVTWMINRAVLKKISPSWESYFPGVDLKMVLSSGVTPYSDFFRSLAKVSDLKEEELYQALKEAFLEMEEKNRDLVEAILKDRSRDR